MKKRHVSLLLSLLFSSCRMQAAPPAFFFDALHHVETGGRIGPILGDDGKALGPLQIHRSYWQDSKVPGRYEDCADLAYSVRVASAYLKKYAPRAWEVGDMQTLARVHNGGPSGTKKSATKVYWQKVEKALLYVRKN